MRFFKVIGWIIVILLSGFFFYESIAPYIFNDLAPRKVKIKPFLVIHFVGAFCTLFIGPMQFWPSMRKKYLHLHRSLGKIYIIGSLIGAAMVFYLLPTYPLPGAIPALFMLAGLWILVLLAAWYFIRKRDIRQHKKFMIRSYVYGLAFIFIRLMDQLEDESLNPFSFIPDQTMRFTLYEWMCWAYPFVITEILLVWWPSINKHRISTDQTKIYQQ
ncbi:DUF2306 domain-containing protein [Ekhidna sp.]